MHSGNTKDFMEAINNYLKDAALDNDDRKAFNKLNVFNALIAIVLNMRMLLLMLVGCSTV